ncbi:hypothetical protein [Marinobacter sp.]|uniref:hypothetical protein n=1 Tax=Marinobacter sp. TaxID=50741 RepID=UPI003A94EB7B
MEPIETTGRSSEKACSDLPLRALLTNPMTFAKRFIAALAVVMMTTLLAACGGGGGGGGGDNGVGVSVNGGGTKGPLANAIVKIYNFDPTQPDFKSRTAIAQGRTNDSAAIIGLVLPKDISGDRPLIIEVTSDDLTTDLTTGLPPVITTLRTALTGKLLQSVLGGKPVFATPLTTVAVDLAILKSNPATTTEFFSQNLNQATGFVVKNLGFGMSQAIDIFSTPPVLSANNTSLNDQARIAELRTAVEAMTAIVVELQNSIRATNPASSVSTDHIMGGLSEDLTDGVINGLRNNIDVVPSLRDVANITTIISTDPGTLFVPGTSISLNDVEQILVNEAAITCGCDAETVSLYLADGTIDVQPQRIEPGLTASVDSTVVSTEAVSNTIFQINFSNPVDTDSAENINNYSIVDDAGNELEVIFARLGADPTQVLLTTAPQSDTTYQINVNNVIESQLPDDGSTVVVTGTPELGVKTVVATSGTRVVLTFTEAVTLAAENPANYQINSVLDGQVLAVKGAVLEDDRKTVVLVTGLQREIGYRLTATNIMASQNEEAIKSAYGTKNFIGSYGTNDEKPMVVGAISTGNNKVIVAFSKAMNDEAINPDNYSIMQENGTSLVVSDCPTCTSFYGPDRQTVELTTLSQSEIAYKLRVVNVQDMQGQQFYVENTLGGFFTADNADFAGTPPGGGSIVDFDGDGLLDNEEQRGWPVFIVNGDGQTIVREVTSDPTTVDTDGDGLTDAMERGLNIDPRSRDTDGDTLADAYEFNAIFSSPTDQDSDNDGLKDHEEVLIFKTSPIMKDTDGDQIADGDEIILGNRNPRVADLAIPLIEVESLNLQLDVRFDKTIESVTTRGETQSFSSSLSQSSNRSYSRSNAETNKTAVKVSAKNQFKWGGFTGAEAKVTVEAEAGFEHGWSSRWSSSSRQGTRAQYEKSREFSEQVSEGTTVTRRVDGAQVSTLIYLSSLGDIAFSIKDIQVTALMPDPRDPEAYIPFATLVPDNPDGSLVNEFNLGPLTGQIGPIVFTNKEVYPSLVEKLMGNPSGVIFKVTNYNVENEDGRNFAFSSQEVVDKTAALTIDYGSSSQSGAFATERYRVATNFGRPVSDFTESLSDSDAQALRAAFGLDSDDTESVVAFDLQGYNTGVNFHDVMQDVLGLTRYDAANDTYGSDESLNSYATEVDSVTGIERITRVRQTTAYPALYKQWSLITPSGLILDAQLSMSEGDLKARDQTLYSGQSITLAYVTDEDTDLIPARVEYLFGCSDSDLDTDKDGLSDRLELFGSTDESEFWTVDIRSDRYLAYASCNSDDSDQDGLSDYQEYGYPNPYDSSVSQVRDPLRATDPKNPDTDGDGIPDKKERDGYLVYAEFAQLCTEDQNNDSSCTKERRSDNQTVYFSCDRELDSDSAPLLDSFGNHVLRCTTDPLNADTDGDGMVDGGEHVFNANPTLPDLDNLTDDDNDGLLALEEINGWPVKVYNIFDFLTTADYPYAVTKACSVGDTDCDFKDLSGANLYPDSNPLLFDTDGDGLSDYEEKAIGSHPRLKDTDGDGLTDFYEENGFAFDAQSESFAVRNTESQFKGSDSVPVITSAIVQDYDADGISDGDELTSSWIVSVGAASSKVYSSPRDADIDLDGLLDGEEYTYRSDPNKSNTDEDQQEIYPINDAYEVVLGLDPTDPSDMCLKIDIFQQELGTTADTRGQLQQLEWDIDQWSGATYGEKYLSHSENIWLTSVSRAVAYPWYTFKVGPTETRYVRVSSVVKARARGRVWKWDTSGADDAYFDLMVLEFSVDDFVDSREVNKSAESTDDVGSSSYKNTIRALATVMTKPDVDGAPSDVTFCQGQSRTIN